MPERVRVHPHGVGNAKAPLPSCYLACARGFARLRHSLQAATYLFQDVGLNIGALYLTGYAYILAHSLHVGPFTFDSVNLAEIEGPTLLGLAMVGSGAYRSCRLSRSVRAASQP